MQAMNVTQRMLSVDAVSLINANHVCVQHTCRQYMTVFFTALLAKV